MASLFRVLNTFYYEKELIKMLKYYVLIGVIVQLVIIFERAVIRKVIDLSGVFDTLLGVTVFSIALLIGSLVNIAVWPVSIVFEIINVKEGI